MMTQGEIESLSMAIERNARNLEIDIMLDIVRRIKANLDIDQSMTSSADYQIQVLRKMGYSDEFLKKEIQNYLDFSDEEIDRIYNQTTKNLYKQYEDAFDILGKKQTPFGRHPEIQPVINAAIKQSKNTFQNITQSMGFTRNANGKREFLSTAKFYQRSLDEAVLGVTTGAFSYDVALKRIIKDMTRSGLRTVEYASGRTYRVDSACRTALMTGFRQIVGRINEQVAAELGTDTYEVSYHIGARPDHQVWQGRVYSYKELESVCGLGTVTGLCGANCYHWYDIFIPGVSVRNYTDEELQEMMEEENKKTSYDGKEYTTYEALQRQRKLELTMRVYRQDIKLMKEGEVSELEIMGVQARYKRTMDEYVKFSKAMKLPQQMERVYGDRLGKAATYKRGYLAAEKSLRTKDGEYSVKWNIVKSKQYSERFEKISANSRANQLAAQRARNALARRDGKNTEEIYAIGLFSGRDISSIIDQHYPFGVKRTEKFQKDICRAEANGEKVLFVHNHPGGSPPSIADLNELLNHDNAVGITVGHTGSIYYYSKPNKKIEESELAIALRKVKGYTGNVRNEKALEELSEKYKFEFKIL